MLPENRKRSRNDGGVLEVPRGPLKELLMAKTGKPE